MSADAEEQTTSTAPPLSSSALYNSRGSATEIASDTEVVQRTQHNTEAMSANCTLHTDGGEFYEAENAAGGTGVVTMNAPSFFSGPNTTEEREQETLSFNGGIRRAVASCPTTVHGDEINTTSPNRGVTAERIPLSSNTIVAQTSAMGISGGNSSSILDSGAMGIPQAPQRNPGTTGTTSSIISTPVGSTFSISSRGCTSATAPSTTSSTSSTTSTSTNQTRTRNNASTSSHNQFVNHSSGGPSTPFAAMNSNHRNKSSLYVIGSQIHNPFKQQGTLPSSNTSVNVCNNAGNANQNNEDTTGNNVDRIDSALLSALCDPRERFGLLRLEQVLVDFMNERTTGYIEVGGPNNSIVIGGQSGGRLAAAGSNTAGDEVRGRQTSFQRLCLHRLADRFNIVRESASSSWSTSPSSSSLPPSTTSVATDDYNGSTTGGSGVPGLIRLVKVKNSRIPSKLLIDLDVSSYCYSDGGNQYHQQRSFDSITREGEQSGSLTTRRGSSTSDNIRSLTDNLSSASIGGASNNDVVVVGRRQNQQPRRKMMIMKRGGGSSGSLRSNSNESKEMKSSNVQSQGSGGRSGLKGKNLSDKEKAYAEARARIFNEMSGSYNAENEERKQDTSIGVFETSQTVDAPSTPPPSMSRGTVSSSSPPSPVSATSSGKGGSSGVADADADRFSSEGELESESPTASLGRIKEQQNTSRAASATNSAVSKVTWRNRRQEENDPDFRRGVPRPAGGTGAVATVIPQLHYGTASAAAGGAVFVGGTAPSSGYTHHGGATVMNDSSYAILQQHTSPVSTKAMGSHYHHPQQHVFYGTPQQQITAHHQYNANSTGGGHHSYVIPQQQQAAAAYYAQHQQQATAVAAAAYFAQNHDHHQGRQPYHHRVVSAGGNRNSYAMSTSGGHSQIHQQHGMFYSGSAGTTTGRRSTNAIYNADDFPALR